jgi:hypothetical protein
MEFNLSKPAKRTPVEFLVEELDRLRASASAITQEYSYSIYNNYVNEVIKTALEMEKSERAYVWVEFDFNKIETRPKGYGKYLIERKDGKHHWETWNGSGWAYNHNEIRFYATINPAKK